MQRPSGQDSRQVRSVFCLNLGSHSLFTLFLIARHMIPIIEMVWLMTRGRRCFSLLGCCSCYCINWPRMCRRLQVPSVCEIRDTDTLRPAAFVVFCFWDSLSLYRTVHMRHVVLRSWLWSCRSHKESSVALLCFALLCLVSCCVRLFFHFWPRV